MNALVRQSDYAAMLRDPRWQRKRLEIMQRDGWTCTRCGAADRQLHVHHVKYYGKPWESPGADLFTLCDECHSKEHSDEWKPGQYDGDPFWSGPLTRLSMLDREPWRCLPTGDVIPTEDEWMRDEGKEVSAGWWIVESDHDGFFGLYDGDAAWPTRYPGGAGVATHRQVCEWIAERMANAGIERPMKPQKED